MRKVLELQEGIKQAGSHLAVRAVVQHISTERRRYDYDTHNERELKWNQSGSLSWKPRKVKPRPNAAAEEYSNAD